MKGQSAMPYSLRPMRLSDASQVAGIEREAFSTLWTATNYKRGLRSLHEEYLVCVHRGQSAPLLPLPRRSLLDVLRRRPLPPEAAEPPELVVGFVGVWFTGGEGHITSIAVHEAYRRQGLGELLLMGAVEITERQQQQVVTLEVRVSNIAAQNLYQKYGFSEVGVRRHYYSDNREDALIMSTDTITASEYRQRFETRRAEFIERYGHAERTYL